MKKIFSAVTALCMLSAVSSLTAHAESISFDYDTMEKLYYAEPEKLPMGDANLDGVIDGRDATAVLTEYAAVSSGKGGAFNDEQNKQGDVNTDKTIDARDASAILTFYAQQSSGKNITIEKYMAGVKADNIIKNMSLHNKICQMFIVRPEALAGDSDTTAATQATADALKNYPVGGIIYFTKNLQSADQIKNMISTTQNYASQAGAIPLFYGVDEEGGAVSRCAEALGTVAFEPMYTYKEKGPVTAYANARKLCNDIKQFGFNLDFAPVADTWSNHDNTVIGTRAYSDNFEETAMLVGAAVRGFDEGGVFCTLKHFPGHGNTNEDSHNGIAVSNRTADELKDNEYIAFDRGINAGADMVMVGHITVPSIDTLPASLSQKIVEGQLRGVLGYDGVIITDALEMGAVANNYSSAETSVMAVEAGCDIILTPKDLSEAVTSIENAVKEGKISEERINASVKRILVTKSKRLEF